MMKTFSIQLKGNPAEQVEAESLSVREALDYLKVGGLDRVVAVKVNGVLKDLASPLEGAAELAPVYLQSDEGVEILRHSASHVMAMAVKELFPGVKVTIGPAIENGFYYDFDYERPFREDDLPPIEKKMKEIIQANLPFARKEMAAQDAIVFFRDQGEDYKVELIEDLGAEEVSLYTQGSFTDLCRGPHIPSTGMIQAFHLTRVAGA